MNEKKIVQNSFKSYIKVKNGEKNGAVQELKPKLLNNELIVGEAHDVVMLRPLSDGDCGRYGSLFVTNYRLSFVPLEKEPQDECGQRHRILGAYDIPLAAVGSIWLTDGGPVRRRRLLPAADIQGKVKGLQVVCKNMKVLTFNFTPCAMGKGRSVAMALLHHAFPRRHDLLFAFECREPYLATQPHQTQMFLSAEWWRRERARCGQAGAGGRGGGWRVSLANGAAEQFLRAAPPALLVPASVLDCTLVATARHFRSGSIPIWVWGRSAGAALLRCGELLPTDHSSTAESVYLEQVRKSHPKLTPPHVIYPCGNSYTGGGGANILPSLSNLQNSYERLVDLCTPTTLAKFWVQDSQYYSLLDSCRWARHVASCLALADEAAASLADNVTVLLQEGDGVDYAAVISSLTQLLVDPYFRSIEGFQALVQKEWVALGHPFCDRLGLPRPGAPSPPKDPPTTQRAPVFLLFLDCTWQLTRQHAQHFQFTETYLTSLWDAVHDQLLDTFLFNCPRDRDLQVAKEYIQRPVWDWAAQFSEADIALFYNPLYNEKKPTTTTPAPSISSPPNADPPLPRLSVNTLPSSVELWAQCYERWLPPLQAAPASRYHCLLTHWQLLTQIDSLKEHLSSLSILRDPVSPPPPPPVPQAVPRFYPFCQSTTTAAATQANINSMRASVIDASRLLDSQLLLNAPD